MSVSSFLRRAAVAALLLSATASCLQARMVIHNYPSLAAPTYFPSRTMKASPTPKPFERSRTEADFHVVTSLTKSYASFDQLLHDNGTHAFLCIDDGAIVYERYFDATSETLFPSFSIAKTFVGLAMGVAIEEGRIGAMSDPITKYVPPLRDRPGYDKVTLDFLLRMISGIDFEEESTAGATFYYGSDLKTRLYNYDVRWEPGTHYLYGGLNVQLLWDAIHRTLPEKATVSDWFASRVWGPIGAEHDATWSLDSEESGIEKFWAGLNATARDYARLGVVFANGGTIGGDRIVKSSWIDRALERDPLIGPFDSTDGFVLRLKYQWLLTLDGGVYFAKGYDGQYVFVYPAKKLVFVRFGDGYVDVDWPRLMVKLGDEYERPVGHPANDRLRRARGY